MGDDTNHPEVVGHVVDGTHEIFGAIRSESVERLVQEQTSRRLPPEAADPQRDCDPEQDSAQLQLSAAVGGYVSFASLVLNHDRKVFRHRTIF